MKQSNLKTSANP